MYRAIRAKGNQNVMENRQRSSQRATFVEVFGSMKFDSGKAGESARRWPQPGFVVNKSMHLGEATNDDQKQLIRSSN
jgi:hypothetical protein